MSCVIKKEFNKLRHEWRGLNKEHEELSKIEKAAWSSFYEAAMEYIDENNLENPFKPKDKESEKSSSFFETEEAKGLFREAARKTHPDATKESCADLFKNIAAAKKRGDFNEFLENAKKVDIKIENVTVEQIEKLEEEVYELERKINEMLFSVHWIWHHASNRNKLKILDQSLNGK
jgi:hypothetical protein